jgi:nitroimidazol reductase NimA-like FMN-containing flavoprotein (pyridoxamine 5'-phosphate oxidase superfamily)
MLAAPTDPVRVRRQPSRGRYDRADVNAALDGGMVAHVAFNDNAHPFCIPMLYARLEDSLYIHGATSSRIVRTLAQGVAACVTVTVLDGLVLARSAFEHSANYRSVMVLGAFAPVVGEARLAALEAFTNKLVPGRWPEVRKPNGKELRATAVLALPIETASVKVRTGPPSDDGSADAVLGTWAGVVPIRTVYGPPEPSPGLREGIPVASSVERLVPTVRSREGTPSGQACRPPNRREHD